MLFFSKKNLNRKPVDVILEYLGILILCVSVIAASFIFSAEQLEQGQGMAKIIPKCMFKSLTGMPCPSCGMSRAFCSISKGDFERALKYNLFSPFLYFAFLCGIVFSTVSLCSYLLYILKPSEIGIKLSEKGK